MPGIPDKQVFVYGGFCFDIDAAERLLTANPRDPIEVPVAPWADAFGLTERWQGRAPLIGGLDLIDTDYAMTSDLDRPLILATVQVRDLVPDRLLIDGRHRLYRAYREHRAHLPGLLLNTSESLVIRTRLRGARSK